MKFTDLLDLLDSYEYTCEIKGGFWQLNSKNIVITSNRHPKDIYKLSDEDINQLIRRIDVIYDFDAPVELAQAHWLGNAIPTNEVNSWPSLQHKELQEAVQAGETRSSN
jgi:hypothetical protein